MRSFKPELEDQYTMIFWVNKSPGKTMEKDYKMSESDRMHALINRKIAVKECQLVVHGPHDINIRAAQTSQLKSSPFQQWQHPNPYHQKYPPTEYLHFPPSERP